MGSKAQTQAYDLEIHTSALGQVLGGVERGVALLESGGPSVFRKRQTSGGASGELMESIPMALERSGVILGQTTGVRSGNPYKRAP